MRALKLTVLVVLFTIAVVLIAALFLPREIVISQETFINAKPQVVFGQVNSLRNYIKWSPYEEDSTMTNIFEGPEAGVGAKRIWNGKKVGFGSIIITESSPYKLIKNAIEFGPQGKAIETWNFDQKNCGTTVTWTTRIYDLSYPVGRLFGILMDDMMATMETNGLENLKTLSESLPSTPEPMDN